MVSSLQVDCNNPQFLVFMFQFIHSADLHLDSPLHGLERYDGAPVDAIRGATRKALENLVSLAIERKVDFLLISGDVFDGTWKDFQTGLFFSQQMRRLAETDIPVVMIRGNHDAESKMTKSLRLPENVELLGHQRGETAKHPRLSDLHVAVHGRSYSKPAETESLLPTYPPAFKGYFNIGLLHTALTGSENHPNYAPCTPADLKAIGYDYWALGHVHQRAEVALDPPIIFPGNLQGRNIRETGSKGCYLVQVDDQHNCKLEFRPLDVFRFAQASVNIEGCQTEDELIEVLQARLRKSYDESGRMSMALRFELIGSTDLHAKLIAHRERWVNEVRSLAGEVSSDDIWLETLKIRTSPPRSSVVDLDGPLAEITHQLERSGDDAEFRSTLLSTIDELRSKLPSELLDGPDKLDLQSPTWLSDQLQEAHALLLGKIREVFEP